MNQPLIQPNYILLYVDKPPASAEFYAALLGRAPVENSPTFALFVLDSGVRLGLWSRHTVEPAAAPGGSNGELAFAVDSREAVQALQDEWWQRGLRILQPAVDMDFGHTFTALDPDGHRLRVFALSAN